MSAETGTSMPKLRLTIDEMQKLLLDDIRSRPRCAAVAAIVVKRINSEILANNWSIGSTEYGTAESEPVDEAAVNAQARISPHYDLTED
jgi:hypothetical protein